MMQTILRVDEEAARYKRSRYLVQCGRGAGKVQGSAVAKAP